MSCFYCEKSARLDELMVPVCELSHSSVYMLRNQNYLWRCIVAYRGGHKTELFELTDAERAAFCADAALVAKAVQAVSGADKINYGIYGDEVPHLHFHIVPKHRGGYSWGSTFEMTANPHVLSDSELAQATARMRQAIAAAQQG